MACDRRVDRHRRGSAWVGHSWRGAGGQTLISASIWVRVVEGALLERWRLF